MGGYIYAADGLYLANGKNNDANILKAMFAKKNNIGAVAKKGDIFILDRGFRDVVTLCEDKNIEVFMPQLLYKKQKFDDRQANLSRMVTILRWVVEAVNGRLKNIFHYFDLVITIKSLKNLNNLLLIALAIINKFSAPLFKETDFHSIIITKMFEKINKINCLEKEVKLLQKKTKWSVVDESSAKNFPRLSLDHLNMITLGQISAKYRWANYTITIILVMV